MLKMYVQAILLAIMVFTGFAAIFVKDLLAAIIMFGAFSFFAVLIYLVLGAPDVAFTEAVVGVVSTTFFVIALNRVRRRCS